MEGKFSDSCIYGSNNMSIWKSDWIYPILCRRKQTIIKNLVLLSDTITQFFLFILLYLWSIHYCSIPSADEPPKDGYDLDSQSVVRLKINQVLFMKQINRYLALVGVVKKENFEKQGLIDYNFNVFKKGVSDVLAVGKQPNDVLDPSPSNS